MTKLYWVIGGICMSVGLARSIVFWKVQKDMNKADPAYIVQFIKGNIGNEDISVAIQYNQ
ncbi:hypothetical protein I6G82_20790 [Lysinibacillus macroides]|uniref:Uncharacterized protein n=1 Tax=Lysinibacillus macroides TaxID=33935 RepID=A0A0M9DH77_9BACI|nr:hypothetical protein [Lysinibacillus macroides]KOY80300.1 hypothetical protein ADM90_20865 [Lysinibacillus macroides]QPR67608.1 hypothetical protein I6G82_20790 [Lysinibacillus macroides]